MDEKRREAMNFLTRLGAEGHVSFEQIALAMKGNMVWCRNGEFASEATPCDEVICQFKKSQRRLATPAELDKCRTFQITTISSRWATARHVYPEATR